MYIYIFDLFTGKYMYNNSEPDNEQLMRYKYVYRKHNSLFKK